jgi:hypothetical protein
MCHRLHRSLARAYLSLKLAFAAVYWSALRKSSRATTQPQASSRASKPDKPQLPDCPSGNSASFFHPVDWRLLMP